MKHRHHQLEGARSRAGCEVVSSRSLVPRSTPMVYEDLLVPPVPIVTTVFNEPGRCHPMESSSATAEVRGMETMTGGSRFHRAGRHSPIKCQCHCPSPPLSWITLPPFVLLSALLPPSSPVLPTVRTFPLRPCSLLLLNPLSFPALCAHLHLLSHTSGTRGKTVPN